jgi:hypothetical protein
MKASAKECGQDILEPPKLRERGKGRWGYTSSKCLLSANLLRTSYKQSHISMPLSVSYGHLVSLLIFL